MINCVDTSHTGSLVEIDPLTNKMILPHPGITMRVMRSVAWQGYTTYGISSWLLVLKIRPDIVIGTVNCDRNWVHNDATNQLDQQPIIGATTSSNRSLV